MFKTQSEISKNTKHTWLIPNPHYYTIFKKTDTINFLKQSKSERDRCCATPAKPLLAADSITHLTLIMMGECKSLIPAHMWKKHLAMYSLHNFTWRSPRSAAISTSIICNTFLSVEFGIGSKVYLARLDITSNI